ncbi:MAG: penicillin-binding transpeptidase domain-containing protein [Verrucomicrobiota bacterium]
MEPGYRLRLYLLTALVLVGFGVLLTRLHEFQIERRNEFLAQVPGNRTVTIREPGIRGEITDRNGIILARNLRKYEISFNLDEIHNSYRSQHENNPIIERVVNQNGMARKSEPEKDIVSIVKDGDESTIGRLKKLGLAKNFKAGDLRTHYITHGGLVPYSYRTDLSFEDFSKFAEHNLDLTGVNLGMRPQRQYPFGALASHVIGYLKQWEKGDVPESATREFDHYIGDEKGINGIEASMDKILRGPEGRKTIVKDEKGRTIRMRDYTKPGTGARVQLTIDARLQYLMENTLRYAGRAAGVVMDVNTGEVLAMASVPDYNPNDFIPSIAAKRFEAYNSNKQLAPFTNRAISAFTPGSTMKIPTAVAGALAGMASRIFSCDGYVTYGNKQVGCWIWNQHKGSHGSQNISQAIQHSCNPYFNKLANAIGWKAMVDGCQMVGIGKRTGIELPKEDAGILPGSKAWRAANPNAAMTPALNAFLSIGQGDSLATPLQMCAVTATIANGGKYFNPRIVKKAVSDDGKVIIGDAPKLVVDITQAGVKTKDLELIRKGMWMSANEAGGTTGKVKIPKVSIAAKSGTAQTIDNGKKSNNSWIITFAPYENPKYAICILVQNGGSGGGVCGPLANLVYRGIFAQDAGVRLVLKPQTEVEGNTNRIEKTIEIPPKVIAAVEAGDTSSSPDAIATNIGTPDPANDADAGETGDEAGDDVTGTTPTTDTRDNPKPTLTPEIDDEGTVIPKAVPVPEP